MNDPLAEFPPSPKRTVVVFLHGIGGSGVQEVQDQKDKFPELMTWMAPDRVSRSWFNVVSWLPTLDLQSGLWSLQEDSASLHQAVRDLDARIELDLRDSDEIVLVGFSQGGSLAAFAWRHSRLAHRFTAVFTVCSHMPEWYLWPDEGKELPLLRARKIPLTMIFGTHDILFPSTALQQFANKWERELQLLTIVHLPHGHNLTDVHFSMIQQSVGPPHYKAKTE